MTVTVDPTARPVGAPQPPGGHRRRLWRTGSGVGLAAALAAAVALLVLSPTDRTPVRTGPVTAEQAWPGVQRAELPGSLPDGPAYQPVFFLDAQVSIGTAPSPDGSQLRLVHRAADGTVRELRRLPLDAVPQFSGFTLAGDQLAWAESTEDAEGRGRTRMWAADLSSRAEPRQLTADTGAVAFFNSQYDMVIADGRLHWVAVGPGEEAVTEVRSVPLSGGPVDRRLEEGAWALGPWPWLVSAGTGRNGVNQLRDLAARKEVPVDVAATELVTCSPSWCRVLVLAGDGPARIDLMRPDGSDRQRVAGGAATSSVVDVALLDRFEVLSIAGPDLGAATSQLLVFDLATGETVALADQAGSVLARGGVLWWSTGQDESTVWHTVDLRTA